MRQVNQAVDFKPPYSATAGQKGPTQASEFGGNTYQRAFKKMEILGRMDWIG